MKLENTTMSGRNQTKQILPGACEAQWVGGFTTCGEMNSSERTQQYVLRGRRAAQ